jgi:hypothetical protein
MVENSNALRTAGDNILLGKRTNALLVKDDVGRAKPSTRALPREDFAFGKPAGPKTDESAADVTNNWQFSNGSRT